MLPGPISHSLAHDTRFQRQIPGDVAPFNFTAGHNVQYSDPTGGLFDPSYSSAGTNDLVEGPDTVNGSINYGIFMDRMKWQPNCTGKSMLNFIRARTHSKMQVGVAYETYSLSTLNSLLRYNLSFQVEFNDASAENLLDTFRLFGVQQNEQSESFEVNADHFQNHHVARRARLPSYWSAIESKKNHRSSIRENDELWLLARRHPLTEPRLVKKPRLAPGLDRLITGYWQFEPYVSDDRRPPNECLYNGDDWAGGCVYVGYVFGIFGESRAYSTKHRILARKALCPDSYTANEWKDGFYSLAEVEVFLGL